MAAWTWTDAQIESLGGETAHLAGWRIASEDVAFGLGAEITWLSAVDPIGLTRATMWQAVPTLYDELRDRHWGRYEYRRDARRRIAQEILDANADRVNELATGPLASPVACEQCAYLAALAAEIRAKYSVLAEAQASLVAHSNADPDDEAAAGAAAAFALEVASYRRWWVRTEQQLRECEARCQDEAEERAAREAARAARQDQEATDEALDHFAEVFASQLVFVDEDGERLSGTGDPAAPPIEIEEWDEMQAQLAEFQRDPEAYIRRMEEEAIDAELDRDEAEWNEREEFIREWKANEPDRRRAAEEWRQAEVDRQGDAISEPDTDIRSQVCDECRPTFDAWRAAVGRLEVAVETPVEDRGPDAATEIADLEFEVRSLRMMLHLCNDLLCDGDGLPDTWLLEPAGADAATMAALTADLSAFRPESDCAACGRICDAIAEARARLRAWAQVAARAQRSIDRPELLGGLPGAVAAAQSTLSHAMDQAERFEWLVAGLLRLLEHCEATKCPDPEREEVPSPGALTGARAGSTAGRSGGDAAGAIVGASTGAPAGTLLLAELAVADAVLQAVHDGATTRVPTQEMIDAWFDGDPIPDEWLPTARSYGWVTHTGWVGMTRPPEVRTSPDQDPSDETVQGWHDGERIPPIWWDAATERGWLGPVIGWWDGLIQPMPIPHQRDRFAIEEALRAWGIPVVGMTRISYRGSRAGDPVTGDGRKTTVVFSLDQHARPIDFRIPHWLRADQVLDGVFTVSVTYRNVDGTRFGGPPGSRTEYWTGRINIWDSKNNRRIDGAQSMAASVYGAVYQPLVRIHDEDRVLRRIDKFSAATPVDPWADSTGFSENEPPADPWADSTGFGEDGPPATDEPTDGEGSSKRTIPLIIGGVAAAIVAIVIGIVATSGGDGDSDSADRTDPTVSAAPAAADDPDPTTPPDPSTPPEPSGPATDPPAPSTDPLTSAPDLTDQQAIVATLAGPDGAAAFLVIETDEGDETTFSIVGVDGRPLPGSQIEQVWSQIISLASDRVDRLVNASAFPCGAETPDYRVTCPIGAGPAPEGQFVLVGVELAGPIGEGARSFTYGLAFDDEEDDVDYAAPPDFDADFFAGTEFWYRLEIDEEGNRQMRADGFVDGVPDHPRYSAAAAIEFDDTLVWLIPRAELPDGPLAYRATAFHDDGEPGAIPDPATSGGDISGVDVDDPLLPISDEIVEYDAGDTIPPDVDGTQPRTPIEGDPDEHLTRVLLEDFFDRLNGALSAGDRDGVIATVLPQLLAGPNGDRCIEELEASLLLANSVGLNSVLPGPDVSRGFPLYTATGQIDYPTGSVEWPPFLIPGPGGRLHQIIGSCA